MKQNLSDRNRTYTQRARVLLFTSLKGLVILASICQSTVLHTLRLWSSAWDAMYFPTGSHVSPFTKPVCPRRHVTISGKDRVDELIRTPFLYEKHLTLEGVEPSTVPQRKGDACHLPGNLRAFQMTMVLSTLQEASQTSWGDHDTSITSVKNKKRQSYHCFSIHIEFLWASYRRCGSSG